MESDTVLKYPGRSISWKEQLIKYRHWILVLFGAIILSLELAEHIISQEFSLSFFVENLLFIFMLSVVAILIDGLLGSIEARTRAVRLLELKHNLSIQLSSAKDWDELTGRIARFPSTFTSPIYTALFSFDSEADKFYLIAEQESALHSEVSVHLVQPWTTCESCKNSIHEKQNTLTTCQLYESASKGLPRNGYCFPLYNGNELIGVMHLHLETQDSLAPSEIDILNGIGFEIAIALKSAQQQRQIAELRVADAAIEERQNIYRDLHDVLAQNIGYLHLKLDQLAASSAGQGAFNPQDMAKMRDAAEESFEIIRGTLAALRSSTTPYLSSLINERSKMILKRKNFHYTFREDGQPRPLPPLVLHNTYFIVQEAINNVSKHAMAQNVDVSLVWGNRDLMVKIKDDGVGFDPDQLDTQVHFGLGIMRDRVALVRGKLNIQSAPGQGTEITLWVPQR